MSAVWEQLRTKYNIPVRHNVPFPTSTARSLEFEPTKIRAEIQGQVGHTCEVAMLAAQRLEHAVFQWHVETDEYSVTFLCGQGKHTRRHTHHIRIPLVDTHM